MREGDIESICIFGSEARKSTDELSDRDVLIVSNDCNRLEQLKFKWGGDGWSVSAYSPSRFLGIVKARSLFVQHLRLEGLMVQDKDGWLGNRLREARRKESYACDAMASAALGIPVERFRSDARVNENLITADLGYVAVRNFGICHLADNGQLSFDYRQVVRRLAADFFLTFREVELLESLRVGKACYRNATRCSELAVPVEDLRKLLSKLFVYRPLGQIESDAPPRTLGGGYSMLRDFEALVVAKLGRCPTDAELRPMGLDQLWKWVCSPGTYSWNVRCLSNSDLRNVNLNMFDQSVMMRVQKTNPSRLTRAIPTIRAIAKIDPTSGLSSDTGI